MERFFSRMAWFSATVVLIILLATLYVLYVQAKPAMQAYGWQFLVDPRWGVPVEKATPAGGAQDTSADLDNGIPTDDDEAALGTTDTAIPMDDDEAEITPDEGAIPTDDEEELVPQDDEEEQAALSGMAPEAAQPVTEIYGGLVPIVGTVLSTVIAMLFAVPLAMGTAVFLSELAVDWLVKPVSIAIELLAAIPSIIYGMWGLFFFGPFIASIFGGSSVSLLVAGLVLGVMIIPFMAALSRDAINTTPDVLKESAYAVGATRFEVVKDIIFPYARAGILGSIIISLGRALGETMAVAFVIGGVFMLPHSLTDPTNSIPVALANNFAESSGLSLAALYYLAFLLFVVSFVVIFAAKYYFLRRKRS